jgi:hypothetical protein
MKSSCQAQSPDRITLVNSIPLLNQTPTCIAEPPALPARPPTESSRVLELIRVQQIIQFALAMIADQQEGERTNFNGLDDREDHDDGPCLPSQ